MSSQSRQKIERVILSAVGFVVAVAPLPLGSNSPLAVAFVANFIGATLVFWSILLGSGRIQAHNATKSLNWPVLLYLAVCLWTLVQWIPWGQSFFADPVWQSTSDLLQQPLQGRISVNPEATLSGLMNLLLYGAVFWLTFQMSHSSKQAWMIVRTIAYAGSAYAIYGIAIYMSGNEWVAIYPKKSYLDSLTSTFVNRNSYATFAGLSLLCATALLLEHMKPYFALRHPMRAKFVIIVEELVAKSALKTLAVLSIFISLLLSASRAGIFSSFIGLIALLLIFLTQQRLKSRQLVYAATTIAVVGGVLFAVGGNYFSKRMDSDDIDASYAFRSYMYSVALDAIKSSPLKGTGFGTYADIIPAFKGDRTGAPMERWDKTHNTYLENAIELGVPATTLLNLSIALVAMIAAQGISRRRRDKLIPALGVCATMLVALHSLVDFSLQIPAVAILYACIMGVAASQSWSATASNASQPEAAPTL